MALPYFHNRLEDSSGGLVSVYGPNLAAIGTPVFTTGKFGQGHYQANPTSRLETDGTFALSNINNLQDFTLEFWLYTDYAVSNGVATPGSPDGYYTPFAFNACSGADRTGTERAARILIGTGADSFYWETFGGTGGYLAYSTKSAVLTWAKETWVKLRIISDSTGAVLGGTKRFAIYKDGVEAASFTTVHRAFNLNAFMDIGYYRRNGTNFHKTNAAIDNIIIYDHATLDYMVDTEYPYSSRRRLRPLIIS